jgi:hypothetical protein
MRPLKPLVLLAALLLGAPDAARAEWLIRPFAGVKFGGGTNLPFAGLAGEKRKAHVGVSTAVIGEIVGFEVDMAYLPGYFQSSDTELTIVSSSLSTFTGNLVIALPRRLAEYTLRPYVVGGAGFFRRSVTTVVPGVLDGSKNLPAADIGGGVIGFVSRNVGVSWELRRLWALPAEAEPGTLVGGGTSEKISMWRANMALAIRY